MICKLKINSTLTAQNSKLIIQNEFDLNITLLDVRK